MSLLFQWERDVFCDATNSLARSVQDIVDSVGAEVLKREKKLQVKENQRVKSARQDINQE